MSETRAPRTLAQRYSLVVGSVLLAIGILGFVADSTFDTGSEVEGGSFLGFEVNGWHNLVHIASGLLLLAAANTRPTAKTVALGFGAVYAIVALWGIADGDQVLGVLPVNGADNLLHLVLAALGIGAGLASPATKGRQLRRRESSRTQAAPVRRDVAAGTEDAGRFTGEAGPDGPQGDNEITRTRS